MRKASIVAADRIQSMGADMLIDFLDIFLCNLGAYVPEDAVDSTTEFIGFNYPIYDYPIPDFPVVLGGD